ASLGPCRSRSLIRNTGRGSDGTPVWERCFRSSEYRSRETASSHLSRLASTGNHEKSVSRLCIGPRGRSFRLRERRTAHRWRAYRIGIGPARSFPLRGLNHRPQIASSVGISFLFPVRFGKFPWAG